MQNTLKNFVESSESNAPEVSISVYVEPVESESDLINSIFVFSYNIDILNQSAHAIQLVNRHWRVFSGSKQIADVKGEGVIGMQPRIKSGDQFQYRSYTVIHDPVGSMSGSYTFVSEDGIFFDKEVPSFQLCFTDRLSLH
jgi:ApaG protein